MSEKFIIRELTHSASLPSRINGYSLQATARATICNLLTVFFQGFGPPGAPGIINNIQIITTVNLYISKIL